MNSLIDALYFYAQRSQTFRYLQTAEYRRAVSHIEEDWEEFRTTLTAEQGKQLDGLLTQEAQITHLEDEASFCSALSIGLTLGRL